MPPRHGSLPQLLQCMHNFRKRQGKSILTILNYKSLQFACFLDSLCPITLKKINNEMESPHFWKLYNSSKPTIQGSYSEPISFYHFLEWILILKWIDMQLSLRGEQRACLLLFQGHSQNTRKCDLSQPYKAQLVKFINGRPFFLIIISTLVGPKYQMKIFKNKGLRTGSSLTFPQVFQLKQKNIRLSSSSLKCELPQKRLCTSSPFKQTKINLPNKSSQCQPLYKLAISQKISSVAVKPQKNSLRIEKSRKNSFKITQCPVQTTNVSNDVQKMIKVLENNYVLSQKQSNLYLIKKEDFSKLLQKIFQFKMATKAQQFFENNQEFTNILKRIWETIDQLRIKNKHNLLKITNNVYEKYTNKEYYGDVQKETSKLRAIQAERLEKSAQIREIQRHFNDIQARKLAMQKFICELQKKNYELQHQYEENNRLNNDLQSSIERRQSHLNKLNADYKEIEEFIAKQDKNKILKLISEDYKNIEGEIYDYAAFLQSNQLASDINYQHIPIVCHTFGLEEQITSINKVLVQNDEVPLQKKGRMLRDILVEIVEKYRKKDIQVEKMLTFKTKCIVTFIEKMKKWLGNWELKQEYLKNLRMEHIHYHTLIEDFFMKDHTDCDKCKGNIKKEISQILTIYEKLQENFKMGNSFY